MKQELLYPISKLPIMANALYTYFLFHFCVISLNLYYQITYIHSQYYLISELKEQDLNQIHEKNKKEWELKVVFFTTIFIKFVTEYSALQKTSTYISNTCIP